ncbi:MAG: MlaC/ttg2D family ABC transporter substrate-binding protein [Gammaproteobacteria bacterium]
MSRLLPIALLACLTLPVGAETTTSTQAAVAGAAEATESARPMPPHRIVRQGVDRLVGFLIGASDDRPDALQVFLDQTIAPHFDFAYMSRWAAGPLYRRLDNGQRTALESKLEISFMGALARNLGSFTRPIPRIDVFRTRPGQRRGEARVPVRVVTDAGQIMRLEFRFYWSTSGWKIYDVTANGASAVAFYREYFGEMLRRRGPDALKSG